LKEKENLAGGKGKEFIRTSAKKNVQVSEG